MLHILFAVEAIHLPTCANVMIRALVVFWKISNVLLWLVGGYRGGSREDCHHSMLLLGALLGSFFLLIPELPLIVPLLWRVGFWNHGPFSDALFGKLMSNALLTVKGGWLRINNHPLNLWD